MPQVTTEPRKRRHEGRQSVLLTKEATIVLRASAKVIDRSLNKTASHIIIRNGYTTSKA